MNQQINKYTNNTEEVPRPPSFQYVEVYCSGCSLFSTLTGAWWLLEREDSIYSINFTGQLDPSICLYNKRLPVNYNRSGPCTYRTNYFPNIDIQCTYMYIHVYMNIHVYIMYIQIYMYIQGDFFDWSHPEKF